MPTKTLRVACGVTPIVPTTRAPCPPAADAPAAPGAPTAVTVRLVTPVGTLKTPLCVSVTVAVPAYAGAAPPSSSAASAATIVTLIAS